MYVQIGWGHSGNCHGVAAVVADKVTRITKAIVHLQVQEGIAKIKHVRIELKLNKRLGINHKQIKATTTNKISKQNK